MKSITSTIISCLAFCAIVRTELITAPKNLVSVPASASFQSNQESGQLQVTARSSFRIRSFREATSTASPKDGENEIDDSPIPTKVWIPAGLDFSCKGRAPGYYTDPSPMSKCQVYHMCMPDGRKYSMLCGIGTIFNQITFVCDHWYNYRCADAPSDYKRNDQLWDQFLSPIHTAEDEYDEEDTPTTPAS